MTTDNPIIIEPEQPARASVIWLHGLGADRHDFAPIVPQLASAEALGLRFIFPHAPIRPVTLNAGMHMRSWYDVYGLELDTKQDEEGVKAAAQLINNLIEKEIAAGIPASRIILAGFSLGGALALHVGLRFPQALAGILALSTYLPVDYTIAAEAHAANKQVPIMLTHGTEDPVLPIVFAYAARDRLIEFGYTVEFQTYPMQHEVCLQEIKDINVQLQQWLM